MSNNQHQAGTILSIHISPDRGTEKSNVDKANVLEDWGLENDGHGGKWDNQVSIFPVEALNKVPADKYDEVVNGGYTENITISGIPLEDLAAEKTVQIGDSVLIQIKRIGKTVYKEHGRPYIVSREGRFGVVKKGGPITVGDTVKVL